MRNRSPENAQDERRAHEWVAGAIVDLEARFDRLKRRLGAPLNRTGPPSIVTYRSYGSRDRLLVTGRVLSGKRVEALGKDDNVWQNLLNTYRRLETDEVPGARVQARLDDLGAEAVSDEEGYFRVWLEDARAHATTGWSRVEVSLCEPYGESDARPAIAEVQTPADNAKFGVISDIDDTVMQSYATELLRMAKLTFLGNAHTRLPFPGVAAFYRALVEGCVAHNPIYYVSSSPWNLYDLLLDFFELQQIPPGSMFLRDWGITRDEILPTDHSRHKLDAIETLFEFYGQLPFILIGDSGQQDPEIYAEIVRRHPRRVLAVYVRDVSDDVKRNEAILKLAEEVARTGATLILAPDSLAMAQHAAKKGWIDENALPDIRREVRADLEGDLT